MRLRTALIEDLPAIVDIYNSTIASRLVTADLEPVSLDSKRAWFFEHNPQTRPLNIAEDDSLNIIGWMSYSSFHTRPAYSGTAEISIYLHEDFRGCGFGREILSESLEMAPSLNIHTVLGYIFAQNEASLKLFFSAGFTEWAHFPAVAVIDGQPVSLKILGWKTANAPQ